MNKIRVLLVDDHTLFRQGIRTLIGAEPQMEVVGEAASAGDAIPKATELRPDVVLMDVGMPTSIKTTSGRSSVALGIASPALAASPTTSICGSAPIKVLIPWRNRVWSSTRSTRILFMRCYPPGAEGQR